MARPPPTPCRVCSRLCVSNKFSHFRQKSRQTAPRQMQLNCLAPGVLFFASCCRELRSFREVEQTSGRDQPFPLRSPPEQETQGVYPRGRSMPAWLSWFSFAVWPPWIPNSSCSVELYTLHPVLYSGICAATAILEGFFEFKMHLNCLSIFQLV